MPEPIGVLFLPAGLVLDPSQCDAAMRHVEDSGHSWLALGGDTASLHSLFKTGKVHRLNSSQLQDGQDMINDTARLWARDWCKISGPEWLHVQGFNVGQSLHRELVYYFLGVLKPAYFLTACLMQGTLAKGLTSENGEWKEIPLSDITALLPALIGRACGVRRMVIEEDKKGWLAALRRGLLWARDIAETLGPKIPKQHRVLISSNPSIVSSVMWHSSQLGNHPVLLRPLLGVKPWAQWSRRGVLCRVYADYENDAWRQKVRAGHARILSGHPAWEMRARESRFFFWRGVDWREAVKPQFDYYFQDYMPVVIGYALMAVAVLEKEKIKGILLDEDVCEFNRTLAGVAGHMGIPSVVIQHGAPYALQPTGLSPVTATKIAAWGKYSQDLLRRWGVPADKIFLAGVPRYDDFTPYGREEARAAVFKALPGKDNGPLFVYACDPYHKEGREDYVGIPSSREEEERHLRCFFDGLAAIPQAIGVVKLHPKDNNAAWATEIARAHSAGQRVAVMQHFSTLTLLKACDALVTMHSTVAIEAMLLEKPVITVNLTARPDLQLHAEMGAALPVHDKEEMAEAMQSVLSDDATRKKLSECAQHALDYYIEYRDGKAAMRVAKLLDRLMQGGA